MPTLLRLIDPASTFELDLGRGVSLRCRLVSAREFLEIRELRDAALKGSDADLVSCSLVCLRRIVVETRGIDAVDELVDLATVDQLWEILRSAVSGQLPGSAELQQSEPRPPGTAAASVNGAPTDA